MLTVERLRELLEYNSETGVFTWVVGQCQGKRAGSQDQRGYKTVLIDGKRYYIHRLAWLYMTGDWPKKQIDHINRDKSDQRFANLRDVAKSRNMLNSGLRADNRSGFRGVSFHAQRGRWGAQFQHKHLGLYDTPEEAAAAYRQAAQKLHGDLACV